MSRCPSLRGGRRGATHRVRFAAAAFAVIICTILVLSEWRPLHIDMLASQTEISADQARICPDLNTVPTDFVPWLKEPWDREKVRQNGKAIIVFGTESSGSKLIALTAMRMQHLASNIGRRDPENPFAEATFWDEVAWGGHGSIGQPYSQWVVIHRSLPQYDCYPTAETLIELLGPGGFGIPLDRFYIIVATRDRTVTLRSKMLEHQPAMKAAVIEQGIAAKLLEGWVKNPDIRTYVFSYESFMMLGLAYLHPLAEFLGTGLASIDPMVLPGAVRDANVKWQAPRSLWDQLHQTIDYLFGGRRPAYQSPKVTQSSEDHGAVAGSSISQMQDLLKWKRRLH